ncbi:MAG: response regulator transcription factor [Alphaproteobacteria bacterium]|nr:response regulator transcription factor [Alphaproteobacteria bacterium]
MSATSLPATPDSDLLAEPTVLLVEDDHDVASTIRRYIERAGIKVGWARNGAEAIQLKESMRPDIVLVDLTLPDVDGSQLVKRFAAQHDCGVIVVSGRSDEIERIVGIEQGADDYVTKPVPLRELLARIRAVHRRAARAAMTQPAVAEPSPPPAQATEIMLGSTRVDLRRRIAVNAQQAAIHLTSAEFAALEQLVEAMPEPVSREKICGHALRRTFHVEDRGVDQLILGLRRKLFADDIALSVIVSVRGQGYAIAGDRELMAVRPGA